MCPFFTTFVLLALVAGLFYKFLVWNFGYWKKLGVKEGKSYPFVGSFPSQFTQKRHVVYDVNDLYQKYKQDENFVGVYNARTPQLLIVNPEYAHKIFVNDFRNFHDNEFANFVDKNNDVILANNIFFLTGEEWKERRAEITPGLTANRVSAVYPVTLKVCNTLSDYIRNQIKMASKDGLETKQLCLRYTTEVVSDCVLGIKANSFSNNPTPIFDMTLKVFKQSTFFILYTVIANLIPQIRKIYTARFFTKDVENFFFDLMSTSIDIKRKARDTTRLDYLNYVLQLQEKKNLTNIELISHTMTFLTDGFETTSAVLAHTLLLLAREPRTQEKLRTEIGNEELSFEKLSELPYLDACVHEALRLFPPQLVARKLCTETYEFVNKNGNTVKVHPGEVLLVPIHAIHHDAEYYEDPEEIKPERFLEENGGVKKYREMGVYLGFGDGPRVCPGMRFALTQMKAAIVEIVRNFNIKLNPKTRKDNYLDEIYFMAYLNGGIWLDFEERK
ncbi:probable cytochrome P450 28d1 [Teleopsis dalmanni]|uniref:probable cytochrome P450 28d1 n=1 Tax=Teleopsis dalmanni TaxID=139649 RepID=UPI0018CFBEA8|nr:probable cytochrome P450 28d1 [Teleopsis dalmanni]XP_037954536.1 probable cytochrome P450 28d1 [Teleopsis dalmanni]